MKVVSTFHAPSSVVSSVQCSLASGAEHLVVAKTNRLEVFSVQPEGLKLDCTLELWGKLISVKAFPKDNSCSNLIVMTDHPDPKLLLLTYIASNGPSLTTVSTVSLSETYARKAEYYTDVLVHPSGKMAIASCHAGRLKVVMLQNGRNHLDFDVSIPEYNILSLAFLYSELDTYELAILHFDHQQRFQLLSRTVGPSEYELSSSPSTVLPITILPSNVFVLSETTAALIPVPPRLASKESSQGDFTGGVLVVGGRDIFFFELASDQWQEKQTRKQTRLEKRKTSEDEDEVRKAKEKETEREGRKRKASRCIPWPWSDVTAWCRVDKSDIRYLLGDAFGRLAILAFESQSEKELILIPLGETSSPTSLTHIANQIVYVGSHMGDSQLLRIHSEPQSIHRSSLLAVPSDIPVISASSLTAESSAPKGKGKEMKEGSGRVVEPSGSFIEVVEKYENLAPIMDAVLADLDGSGQPQIVTCSGGRNSGSIKVIRNGADFHEMATVDGILNSISLWPIRARFQDTLDTHLAVSTPKETRFYRLDGDPAFTSLEQSSNGFIFDLPTLALSNIPERVVVNGVSSYVDSPLVIQATSREVALLQWEPILGIYARVGTGWSPDRVEAGLKVDNPAGWKSRDIVAVGVNASQLLLGLSGGRLVLLNLRERDQFQVMGFRDFRDSPHQPSEIAAISCSPLDPSRKFCTLIAVSFWGSNRIEILSPIASETDLPAICKSVTLPSLPRSLLLHNFGHGRKASDPDYHPHLLIGLGDGSLVIFNLKDGRMSDKKVVRLGNTPVSFSISAVKSMRSVFAYGNRASILFWEKGRLQHSSLALKDVVTASQLNAANFPTSLVLGTHTAISIGAIRELDKMHIRSIPFGLENPRLIAYHSSSKSFGIACLRMNPARIGEADQATGSFQLLDGNSFDVVGKFSCDLSEEVSALETLDLKCGTQLLSYFGVGTLRYQPHEREPTDGRILVLDVSLEPSRHSSTVSVLASVSVSGCVYALTSVSGYIAAAINTAVVLFELDGFGAEDVTRSLRKTTAWNHNYLVTSLVSRDDILVLGDAISSVSILKVIDGKLQIVARDYGPLWPVCVQTLDDKSLIGANCDCNLFTFRLVQHNGSEVVMERDGDYHMGDMINKFIPGSLSTSEKSMIESVEPKQIFFTASGRIGVIIDMDKDLSKHMSELQRNMESRPENTDHASWRAPANERGRSDAQMASVGFLDGDFLERFLSHSPASTEVQDILEGDSDAVKLNMSYSQIRQTLETLQSMH